MSSPTSPLGLLVSLVALGIYGYSAYFLNYNANLKKMHELIPPSLRVYGQLKFLTYHCLLIQLLNAALHVGAYFVRAFQKPRDIVFTCLAYPVGSIVVYSFWAVWHLMGRELIFPVAISQYYPEWLNHSTHSIIVPINLLMTILINHKYSRNGALLTLAYFGSYTVFLHYVKYTTGHFVYRYMETMNDLERLVYFAATGLFGYLMYKSGQYWSSLVNTKTTQRPPLKKQKQK